MVVLALLCGAAAPDDTARPRPTGPVLARPLTGLPLDADGIPTRPLNDEELHRLLLALSATNASATTLLTRCHAEGKPYGANGWRTCIDQHP